jgi:hypothetical protein
MHLQVGNLPCNSRENLPAPRDRRPFRTTVCATRPRLLSSGFPCTQAPWGGSWSIASIKIDAPRDFRKRSERFKRTLVLESWRFL